jgi:cytochrome c-type protein NapB
MSPGSPTPRSGASGSSLWVALAAVVGISFVGFAAGTSTQAATSAPTRSLAPQVPGAEAVHAARPYRELRETRGSTLRNFTDRTLTPSGQEPSEATPDVLDDAAIAKVMAERASRRAYDGAPPTIPHAVHQQDASACLACHGRALEIGNLRANFPSHHPMSSCNQCHVPNESPVPGGLLPNALPVAHVEGLPPRRGERAWGGAPPVIPHPTFLRERCMSCHGPTGNDPIRTTHPWRQSCTQCHAPDAERDQHP